MIESSKCTPITIQQYPNYSVNRMGEVFNSKLGRKLRQYEGKGGYRGVYLYNQDGRKFFLVHRLVAMMFIPNPNDYPVVNHKDENPANNNADNLEWCTALYNSNYGTHNEKLRQRMVANNPFKGKKHTAEAKEKMSIAKKERESCRKRKVTIDGIEYPSVTEAMNALHISTRRLYKILEEVD